VTSRDEGRFDPYKTLQVDPEADPEVIQAAYRRLAQKWHPDLAAGTEAATRMVAINRAWEVVGDPGSRAAYDLERAAARRATEFAQRATEDARPPWARGASRAHHTPTGAERATADRGSRPGGASAGRSGSAGHGPEASRASEPGPPTGARPSGGDRPGGSDRPGDRARPGDDTRPGAGSGTQGGEGPASARPGARAQLPPEEVSRDWSSGRSATGYTYDAASMRMAEGTGAAGRPPGNPSGSVLNFGRYAGWSLGEIGRSDLVYLEWLDRMPIGRPYRDEIDAILRRTGRRRTAAAEASDRRGLFRRR
jgi:curved DNA-binding protein CbpA